MLRERMNVHFVNSNHIKNVKVYYNTIFQVEINTFKVR